MIFTHPSRAVILPLCSLSLRQALVQGRQAAHGAASLQGGSLWHKLLGSHLQIMGQCKLSPLIARCVASRLCVYGISML